MLCFDNPGRGSFNGAIATGYIQTSLSYLHEYVMRLSQSASTLKRCASTSVIAPTKNNASALSFSTTQIHQRGILQLCQAASAAIEPPRAKVAETERPIPVALQKVRYDLFEDHAAP